MKNYNKILEAVNKGIQLALDDFDFNDNIESNHISNDDIISIDEQLFAQHIVEMINSIDIKNAIPVEPIVKQQIRKLYKSLRKHLGDNKYIATSREELKNLIRHIVVINPKENLNWIDTSRITNMYAMFDDFISKAFCGDVSDWDMSNVTNTRNMFYRCEKFNCDLSKWDVSNVRLMGSMFSECYKFNSNISKWDVSNVTEMSGLFSGCYNFNQDISNWDVSNVTDVAWMFSRCRKFNQDLSGWDVSNVTKYSGFYYDTEFSKHPEKVPNFDINKTMGNV